MAHGGKLLWTRSRRWGAERVFSVPARVFSPCSTLCTTAHHERRLSAGRRRGDDGRRPRASLTGRPGLCFVTRGPGATNASAGVHVARQDSTPMILFCGADRAGDRDREAFQEVDLAAMFAPLAKWSAEVRETARLGEYVARAWGCGAVGQTGAGGAVAAGGRAVGGGEGRDAAGAVRRARRIWSGVAQEIAERLDRAERPLVGRGRPGWSARAAGDLSAFAEARGLPVATGFRRQDYIDNRHRCYAGDLNLGVNPKLAARLREADALLVLGSRLGDIETQGYELIGPGAHPGHDHMCIRMRTRSGGFTGPFWAWRRPRRMCWRLWRRCRRGPTEAHTLHRRGRVRGLDPAQGGDPGDGEAGGGDPLAVGPSARGCGGDERAGNYAAWLHRYFRWKRFGTQLRRPRAAWATAFRRRWRRRSRIRGAQWSVWQGTAVSR